MYGPYWRGSALRATGRAGTTAGSAAGAAGSAGAAAGAAGAGADAAGRLRCWFRLSDHGRGDGYRWFAGRHPRKPPAQRRGGGRLDGRHRRLDGRNRRIARRKGSNGRPGGIAGHPGKSAAHGMRVGRHPLPLLRLECRDQLGHHREHVADHAEISDSEDRRIGILVHRHDRLRRLHPRSVLDGARNSQGHIQLR